MEVIYSKNKKNNKKKNKLNKNKIKTKFFLNIFIFLIKYLKNLTYLIFPISISSGIS